MQYVYIEGEVSDTGRTVKVPLSSAAVVFILRYCQTDLFHVNFVELTNTSKLKKAKSDSVENLKTGDSDSFEKKHVGVEKIPNNQSGNVTSETVPDDRFVRIPVCSLSGLSHSFVREEELPVDVKNCTLPVVQVNYTVDLHFCFLIFWQ